MLPLYLCLAASLVAPIGDADEAAPLQAAIDANPGRMVHVPDGDHVISQRLRITGDGGGLYGYGRIIQSNPAEPVLEIEHAANVRIEGITLTRAEGQQDATAPGLLCRDAKDTVIDGMRLVECRARDAAVLVRECSRVTVRDCGVRNYKRIAIDDRTDSELYGYALNCIDGTGLLVERSTGTMIDGNRIVEERLLPTPELKEEFKLGTLTEGKKPTKPGQLGAGAVSRGYVSNWHQGSAIVVTSPEDTRNTTVRGNSIENAAQGIDLHCDNAVISQNVVDHGMMGIKLTHGCRNVTVNDNLLTHIDL